MMRCYVTRTCSLFGKQLNEGDIILLSDKEALICFREHVVQPQVYIERSRWKELQGEEKNDIEI